MANSNTTPRFDTTSILGVFDSRWVLTGGAFITEANVLYLPQGATATLQLTDAVNKEFQFAKITNRFALTGTMEESALNFKSGPTIRLQEIYKNTSDEVYMQRFRALGFNTKNPDGEDIYLDETQLDMPDRKMAMMQLQIANDNPLVSSMLIYSIGYYTSIDISDSQVSSITQETLNKQEASAFKIYRDSETNAIKGMGVFLTGGASEIKLKPNFFNGLLVSISTNYGQEIVIQNTTEEIDLTS